MGVTAVSPGPVSTELWLGPGGVAQAVAHAGGATADAIAQAAAAQSVTGRFTRPDEVADVVLFLVNGRGSNLTGADIVIDGGLTTSI